MPQKSKVKVDYHIYAWLVVFNLGYLIRYT